MGLTPIHAKVPVGINLDFFWGFEWASADLFKYARAFREYDPSKSSSWEERNFPLELNAQGYPVRLRPGTEAQTLIGGKPPKGAYVLLWEGTGQVSVGGNARESSRSNRKIELTIDYDQAAYEALVQINLRAVDAKDPVRNIRLLPRELEASVLAAAKGTSVFHPKFLEMLKPFEAIRFLNWQVVNQGPQQFPWKERKTLDSFNWGDFEGQGVPLEYMIDLANATGKSPWLHIHHRADDAYIREMATLIRDRLKPGIKVYIEWSNEVWNPMFEQYRAAIEQGKKLGIGFRPGTGEHEIAWAYHGTRSAQVFKIFGTVFGAQGLKDRVVRVLAGWTIADPNMVMANARFEGKAVWESVDLFAMAPYFAHYNQDRQDLVGKKPEEVIALMRSEELPKAFESVRQTRQALDALGARSLALVAYESGQHLADYTAQWQDTPLGNLFVAVNRHPLMRALYKDYLDGLEKAGLRMINLYQSVGAYSGYGSFGLLERQDQDPSSAPKWQGLLDYLK